MCDAGILLGPVAGAWSLLRLDAVWLIVHLDGKVARTLQATEDAVLSSTRHQAQVPLAYQGRGLEGLARGLPESPAGGFLSLRIADRHRRENALRWREKAEGVQD
jgi:hypothetical protein